MDQKRIWELCGKVNAKEASADEIEEYKNLLDLYPSLVPDVEALADFWNHSKQKTEAEIKELVYEKIMLRIQQDETAGVREKQLLWSGRKYLWYAAAVIVLVTAVALYWQINAVKGEKNSFKTIVAAKGTRSHIVLPDGSGVWLNGGSQLKYNTGSDSIREVLLEGEAYFEVVHREDRPFVIHTAQMDIRDIGTSFNVRAYREDGFTEATLIEGAIEVSFGEKKEKTLLSVPNQKITVYQAGDTQQHKAEVTKIHPLLAETAWMKDVMIFKNETFAQLALRMERHYDISIKFQDQELKNRRLTGTFSNETFEQALDALKLIIKFRYSVNDREVTISK